MKYLVKFTYASGVEEGHWTTAATLLDAIWNTEPDHPGEGIVSITATELRHAYECWANRPGGVCRDGCSCECHAVPER